jgi:hypothetical protein
VKIVWTFLITIIWVLPLGLGAIRVANFNHWHLNIWDCAALFTSEAKVWGDISMIGRSKNKDNSWVQLDFESLSPQGVAGYRQRVDKIIEDAMRSRRKLDFFPRVCEDIARKAEELGYGNIEELRFVRTNWVAGSPAMAQPSGHWNPPPLSEMSPTRQITLYQAKLIDGVWKEVKVTNPSPKGPLAGRSRRVPTVGTRATPANPPRFVPQPSTSAPRTVVKKPAAQTASPRKAP